MIVMRRERRPVRADESLPFEDFVSVAAGFLLRLATVVTADPSAAQDVVQSVLERAFRDWTRISALEHRDAYLRRMVINEALSLRRRARRIVLTDEVPDRECGPDHATRIGELEELTTALRRLPPKQRAAIALRYFCDLSDAQIAQTMECREVTVRGYVLRGLRRRRIELDPGPHREDLEER
jgi:RNA polymerase sigma-70 factor (sigma-E family)